ncbi:GPO family capsid scaffolding protein [Bordetella sp. 2513F-2]
MPKKWFTVATEGQTTDGRVIERKWLEDIAETYDRKKYGARIWLEHFRGILPDGPFKAYGDVLAVRTAENEQGQLTLQAEIEPTNDLVAMTKARQKIYTSMEIDLNFANSGKVGLIGLAVTDTPASLGTDILEFAAQHPDKNPLAARKQSPANLFTSALPVEMDFTEIGLETEAAGLLRKMAETFRAIAAPKANPAALGELSEAFTAFSAHYTEQQQAHAAALASLQAEVEEFKTHYVPVSEFAALRAQLDNTDRSAVHRPTATGSNGTVQTDC